MISQLTFDGYGASLKEKESDAIALLREHEAEALRLSPDGFYLAFSGGKDSVVIKELAKRSGVKFKAWYSQTTIDPPELVRFIKQHHAEVEWNRPKRNFFKSLADTHGMPTRIGRWCCEEYKESGGDGLVCVLGVRKAESQARKKRWSDVTRWRDVKDTGYAVCPIVNWTDEDVWQYIRQNNIPYCSLYDEGWKRLGCIGCPMAGEGRHREFERWPRFKALWIKAADACLNKRKGKLNRFGRPYYTERFKSGLEFFNWWMSDNPSKEDKEQECLGLYDE